jgi:hypothetical protein
MTYSPMAYGEARAGVIGRTMAGVGQGLGQIASGFDELRTAKNADRLMDTAHKKVLETYTSQFQESGMSPEKAQIATMKYFRPRIKGEDPVEYAKFLAAQGDKAEKYLETLKTKADQTKVLSGVNQAVTGQVAPENLDFASAWEDGPLPNEPVQNQSQALGRVGNAMAAGDIPFQSAKQLLENPQIAALPEKTPDQAQQDAAMKQKPVDQEMRARKLAEVDARIAKLQAETNRIKKGKTGGTAGDWYTYPQMSDDYNAKYDDYQQMKQRYELLQAGSNTKPPLEKDNPTMVALNNDIIRKKESLKALQKAMGEKAKEAGVPSLADGAGDIPSTEEEVDQVIGFIKQSGFPSTDPDLLRKVREGFGDQFVSDQVIQEAIDRVTGKISPVQASGTGGGSSTSIQDDPYLKLAKARQIIAQVASNNDLMKDERIAAAYRNAVAIIQQSGQR